MVKYFDAPLYEIFLDENSTVKDLLNQIDLVFGKSMPESTWNHEEKVFRDPVFIMSDKKVIKNFNKKLADGQVIEICKYLSGG